MHRRPASARAIAMPRPATLPWLPWAAALLISLACASLAQAQSAPPAVGSPGSVPEKVAPPDRSQPAPAGHQGSVIRPPMQVDPGMHVQAPPAANFPTPTIKPDTRQPKPG